MQFPKGSGLEALDKIVRNSLKFYADTFNSDEFRQLMLRPVKIAPAFELPSIESLRKPVESFIQDLRNTVSQITEKPVKIDYNAVVNSFIQPGATLLRPQVPESPGQFHFSDLDSDGRNELIASFRTKEGIKTLILKKDDIQWYKMAEINNPGYVGVHYRNTAKIAGDGKNYLLLGLISELQNRSLFAYSIGEGNARMMFNRNYNKLELIRTRGASPAKDKVALWIEEAPGIYDIELVSWNGLEVDNSGSSYYLSGKVVPYYIRKLRQSPGDTVSWYNLANAMSKTGNTADAATAVRIGLERNPDALLKDKFNALKSRL